MKRGAINTAWAGFILSVAALAFFVALLAWPESSTPIQSAGNGNPTGNRKPETGNNLLLYCAAGIKAPVEAIARDYENEHGVRIELQYGGSQTLLTNAEVSHRGDLYLPADDSYLAIARGKKLIDEIVPLATMQGVLAVPRGNPKHIGRLADLYQPGLKIAQANPDAAAIGKLTREALEKDGSWNTLKEHTIVFKPTVNDATTDVKLGAADAAISWDVVVNQYPDLESIQIPELAGVTGKIAVAVLHGSAQPQAALHFARYIGARDKGLLHFQRFKYKTVEGDKWSAVPEIKLLAGAMLRSAIEETIKPRRESNLRTAGAPRE